MSHFLFQARKYIFDALGAEYLETTVLDLEAMLEESDNRVPLICLLSTGSDPSPQIEAMAKGRMQELQQLSMGQGQEEAARKLMQVSQRQSDFTTSNVMSFTLITLLGQLCRTHRIC